MIPKECKRLAEVDFPIAEVSKHSAREKSIRHGHPSTLHLWWARRPLAACRAMLLGLLLPDPCDENCPEDFRKEARKLLSKTFSPAGPTDLDLRQAFLKFIADFANWDNSANGNYLDAARGLVKAAHGEEPSLVVDPFAGGGSIPLEALRLGCDAFASDLNPVACLILKVLLENIPRHGPELADELRRVGAEIKKAAEKELAGFYPKDPDGATPIAYLWPRTVRCEAPNCGAEIPIYRSPWLSKKGCARARYFKASANGRCAALLIRSAPKGGPITYSVVRGDGSENARAGYERLAGTKAPGRTANVVCPCCGTVLPGKAKNNRTAAQLSAQKGGADVLFDKRGCRIGGSRLLAVVTTSPTIKRLDYRLPTSTDYRAVRRAQQNLNRILSTSLPDGTRVVPDETLPLMSGTFNVPIYGVGSWGDMFAARQK